MGTGFIAASLLIQAVSDEYMPYFGWKAAILGLLVLNGLFLSFVVSPLLIQREREGKAHDLLPPGLQWMILISFLFSDLGWWGYVVLVVMGY